MPFGIIGRTGPGMRQVVRFGDRSTGRGIFGANMGRGIVTNRDFTAYVCDSAATRRSSQITLGRLIITFSSSISIIIKLEMLSRRAALSGNTSLQLPPFLVVTVLITRLSF